MVHLGAELTLRRNHLMQTNRRAPHSEPEPEPESQRPVGRAVGKGLAIGLAVAVAMVVVGSLILPPGSSDEATESELTERAEPQTLAGVLPTSPDTVLPPPSGTGTELLDADAARAAAGDARLLLGQLEVTESLKVGAPIRYNRDDYDGRGWTDDDGDCLNARHEVLLTESNDTAAVQDCRVVAGQWTDWMTGEALLSPEEATIDHVVPLGHAHRAGAWEWDSTTKRSFANDLAETSTLNIAGAKTNQSKGSSAPDEWRPSNQSTWCGYAISWIRVKARWNLTTGSAEVTALEEMLDTCDHPITVGLGADFVTSPLVAATIVLAPQSTSPDAATSIPDTPPSGLDGPLLITKCDRREESVTIRNASEETLPLAGWRLHDLGANHTFTFDNQTLDPDATLRIFTGAASGTGTAPDVNWLSETIWNNSGDTAFLLDPDDALISQRTC